MVWRMVVESYSPACFDVPLHRLSVTVALWGWEDSLVYFALALTLISCVKENSCAFTSVTEKLQWPFGCSILSFLTIAGSTCVQSIFPGLFCWDWIQTFLTQSTFIHCLCLVMAILEVTVTDRYMSMAACRRRTDFPNSAACCCHTLVSFFLSSQLFHSQ